jgi:succinyl-diaminopimelate desuccinylase
MGERLLSDLADQLAARVDGERDRIVDLVCRLVRAATPNPPGDTRPAMAIVEALLREVGADFERVDRDPTMPNLLATTTFGSGTRHLVLNGHLDVFPVDQAERWSTDPWGGEVRDGKIWGRGVADMKVGTAASILTYLYLREHAPQLAGRLTLTVVSDEETFGPNGATHLFTERAADVTGTACLNGEPSSLRLVRFGEKGGQWFRFTVRTRGGHGAFPHLGPNAIEQSYALIERLREFCATEPEEPPEVAGALDDVASLYDKMFGAGAGRGLRLVTMNVGTIEGGPKVNMIATTCRFEVDFRLPIGVEPAALRSWIDACCTGLDVTVEQLLDNHPNWCAPGNDLARAVQRRAATLTGIEPAEATALGNCDARLWRYRDVPAVVFGPAPRGMGSLDEHVPIDEALTVVKVHAQAAADYLTRTQETGS